MNRHFESNSSELIRYVHLDSTTLCIDPHKHRLFTLLTTPSAKPALRIQYEQHRLSLSSEYWLVQGQPGTQVLSPSPRTRLFSQCLSPPVPQCRSILPPVTVTCVSWGALKVKVGAEKPIRDKVSVSFDQQNRMILSNPYLYQLPSTWSLPWDMDRAEVLAAPDPTIRDQKSM